MVNGTSVPGPGDIVWIDFGPTVGREQSGRRPALVISDRTANDLSGRALLMPVTSRVRGWPLEVLLDADSPVAGAVLVDQLRSLDWRTCGARPAGAVSPEILDEALKKLAALVRLS